MSEICGMHICVSQLNKQLSRQLLGHGSLLMSKGQHPCRISRTCTVSMLTVTGVCYPPRSTVLFAILNRLSTGRITQYCL